MKKLFVFILIVMFVFLAIGALADDPGFLQLERKYIEMYGEPTAVIRLYSKELKFDYRFYQWDGIGIQVTFVKDIKQSENNQWIVLNVLGKCPKCGEYHIKLPMI